MKIEDVKKAIEIYMKIFNKIQSKIEAIQLASNNQESNIIYAGEGELTIEQINENIQEVTNVGFFICTANENELSDNELLIIQSIYNKFENNKGFYTNEYLSDLFNKNNSKFVINIPDQEIKIENNNEIVDEIDYNIFIDKLSQDWYDHKSEFEKIFVDNYERNKIVLETIASTTTTNEIDFGIINIFESEADFSQINQSIMNLQNQLGKIYDKLIGPKGPKTSSSIEEIENKLDENKDELDFKKIIFIIVIIVGICIVSSILLLIFVKPGISAGINSLTGGI